MIQPEVMQFEGVGSYVEGALRLLQFVESRQASGRRFGADADARWASFRGDLATADRIDLMIRDADAQWPGGFGARGVFAIQGVAEDEPFGSQWPGLDPVTAEELWRRLKKEPAPTTPTATLTAIADAWHITLAKHDVDPIAPTDQLIIVGASAIAATIEAFATGTALDWADQVTVVASAPAPRQLAAAGTALLNAPRSARVIAAGETAKVARGARLVASTDAAPADLAAAKALLGS